MRDVPRRDAAGANDNRVAHGEDVDTDKSVRIALAARFAAFGLDPDRSGMYVDLVLISLSEAARRALQAMDPHKYEYQSDLARRYVAEGRAIGEASIAELDEIGERLLTAQTLDEALGSQ